MNGEDHGGELLAVVALRSSVWADTLAIIPSQDFQIRKEFVMLPPSAPALAKSPAVFCTFCSKGSHQVEALIAGPMVQICSECIELCQAIIVDIRAKRAAEKEAVAALPQIRPKAESSP